MAQKVQVLLVDDLDGGEADETVTFALDGKTYEIDLTTANADKLRGLLEPFVKSGRRTGGRASGGVARRASLPVGVRTPRRSAPGRRRTVTRSMTVAVFRRPFARLTRRPTPESDLAAGGSGGTALPSCPRVVRDRGRPHRPRRAPTVSATQAPPRSPALGAAARRRPLRAVHRAGSRAPCISRQRRLDAPARADRPDVQRERSPLQPVEQPRQLVRASRGHQQPHPVRPHGHRRTRPQMPQRRVTRLRGHLQDVEAQARQQLDGRSGHCRPAQFVLVPMAHLIVGVAGVQ